MAQESESLSPSRLARCFDVLLLVLILLQVYSLSEVLKAPVGELINVSGLLISKEEEGEGKVRLVFGEAGMEMALYLPSTSLPPALLPGLRLEMTSVTKVISKKGRNYLRSTPLTRIELVSSSPHVTTSSPRLLVSLDTFHSLTIEVKSRELNSQQIFSFYRLSVLAVHHQLKEAPVPMQDAIFKIK